MGEWYPTWFEWSNNKLGYNSTFRARRMSGEYSWLFCACFGRFTKVWSPLRTSFLCRIGSKLCTEVAIMSTGRSGKTLTEGKARRYSAPSRGRAVRRPEDVVRDVRGLKLRQRVSLVLNDKVLREELEDLVENYVHNGPKTSAEGIRTYQDFLVPSSSYYGGAMSATVTPIADIRGSDTLNYSKQERLLRCKLAATYRLIDMFGWNRDIHTFSTVSEQSICFVYIRIIRARDSSWSRHVLRDLTIFPSS